jgi:hypothetical protein
MMNSLSDKMSGLFSSGFRNSCWENLQVIVFCIVDSDIKHLIWYKCFINFALCCFIPVSYFIISICNPGEKSDIWDWWMSLTGLRYESNPTWVMDLLIIPPILMRKRHHIFAILFMCYLSFRTYKSNNHFLLWIEYFFCNWSPSILW